MRTELTVVCPSGCSNFRKWGYSFVGSRAWQYVPYVIGNGTYRGDSWICQSAIHDGVIGSLGGPVSVKINSNSTTLAYKSAIRNGLSSIPMNSTFPVDFTVSKVEESCWYCHDWLVVTTLVTMLYFAILPFVSTKSLFFYGFCSWIYIYWISFSPDTGRTDKQQYLASLIPFASLVYILYTNVYEYVLPEPSMLPLETLFLFCTGTLAGLFFDYVSNLLPPLPALSFGPNMLRNGLVSFLLSIIGLLVVLLVAVYLMFQHRKYGSLKDVLKFYMVVIPVYSFSSFVFVDLVVHVHHYILALLVIPLTRLKSLPCLLISGFFLGWFSQGAIKFGFDAPFDTQQIAHREGGFTLNSPTIQWSIEPSKIINNTVSWVYPLTDSLNVTDLDDNLLEKTGIGFYSLFMNDYEVYRGKQASFSIPLTRNGFFRVALVSFGGATLDFSSIAEIDFITGNFTEHAKFSK
jgi:hypothetical protein